MANRRELVKRRKAVRNIHKITRTMQMIANALQRSALGSALAGQSDDQLAGGTDGVEYIDGIRILRLELVLDVFAHRGALNGRNARQIVFGQRQLRHPGHFIPHQRVIRLTVELEQDVVGYRYRGDTAGVVADLVKITHEIGWQAFIKDIPAADRIVHLRPGTGDGDGADANLVRHALRHVHPARGSDNDFITRIRGLLQRKTIGFGQIFAHQGSAIQVQRQRFESTGQTILFGATAGSIQWGHLWHYATP